MIQEDTTGFDLDLYRQWLDSSSGVWAKREMINTYLDEGRFDTIETILAAYDTLIEKIDSAGFENFKDYVLAYKEWMEEDSSIMHLDSMHLVELKNLAETDEHKKGTNAARNILNFFYDSTYYTPPVLPEIESYKKGNDEDVNVRQREEITERTKELPTIKLYPNPAKNAITIEYSGLSENDKLIVCNVLGILYETKTLGTNNSKVVLNTSNYQNGIYLARGKWMGNLY